MHQPVEADAVRRTRGRPKGSRNKRPRQTDRELEIVIEHYASKYLELKHRVKELEAQITQQAARAGGEALEGKS